MAPTVSTFSLFLSLLVILLAAQFQPTQGIAGVSGRGGGGGDNRRTILGKFGFSVRNNQVVDCTVRASKSRCSQYPNKCRWCRSDAIDDMCFSKSDAWRLPSQVFSCD